MVVERLMMTRSNPIRFKGSKDVSTKKLKYKNSSVSMGVC